MGKIISLSEHAQPREPAEPPPGGAQILFFLGVRYSRMETEAAAPQVQTDERSGGAPLDPGAERPYGGGKKRKRRARA